MKLSLTHLRFRFIACVTFQLYGEKNDKIIKRAKEQGLIGKNLLQLQLSKLVANILWR